MDNKQNLNHTKWECKYHLVWSPKYRENELFGGLRKYLGSCCKDLSLQKERQILEGQLNPDPVHMPISIFPKYPVSQMVGFLNGKSALPVARVYLGERKNFTGQQFRSRGYFFSAVGVDEQMIRAYKKGQEKGNRRLHRLNLFAE